MLSGYRRNRDAVVNLFSIDESGPTQEMDADAIYTAGEIVTALPPFGERGMRRLISPAIAATFSGAQVYTTRATGFWIDEVWCDFDTNFIILSTPYLNANILPQVLGFMSYDQVNVDTATVEPDFACELGTNVAGSTPNLAFALANSGLSQKVGGRFWVPPGMAVSWYRSTGVNTPWTGSVSITMVKPSPSLV